MIFSQFFYKNNHLGRNKPVVYNLAVLLSCRQNHSGMEQSGSSTRYIFGYFIIRRDIIIKNTTKNEYNKRKREYIKKINEYNKKPNICLFCGSPLIAGYEVKLSEIKKRKFCSSSCAAKYNNIGKIKNPTGKGLKHSSSIINSFSDKEILDVFKDIVRNPISFS